MTRTVCDDCWLGGIGTTATRRGFGFDLCDDCFQHRVNYEPPARDPFDTPTAGEIADRQAEAQRLK
jgi:hypothetical protein